MNLALILATALQGAGLGTLGENLWIGRIQAVGQDESTAEENPNGLWAVLSLGGTPEGGNVAKWRTRTQLQVMFQHSDASQLYANDETVRTALSQLPYVDARFLDVTVGTLQDLDIAESEMRVGVWSVETVTFNASDEAEQES